MVRRVVVVCGCLLGTLANASESDVGLDRTAAQCIGEGQYREAEILEKRAIALRRARTGVRDDPVVAAYLSRLGQVHRELGLPYEAMATLSESVKIYESRSDADPLAFAAALNNLGTAYHDLQRYQDAESSFERAIGIFESAERPQRRPLSHALNNLASVYEAQRKYGAAILLYERALGLLGATDPSRAGTLNNLAGARRACGDDAGAEAKYREAIDLWSKTVGPHHPNISIPLANLGTLYVEQGRYDEAEKVTHESVVILERRYGEDHPDLARRILDYASVLAKLHRNDEAKALKKRAKAIFQRRRKDTGALSVSVQGLERERR